MEIIQTTEQKKQAIRTLYEDYLNTGNLEPLNQLIAEDYTGINGQRGPAAFVELVKALRQGFPDIRWTIEDLVAEGDRVAVRWRWEGTHAGAFRGFLPTRKQVTDRAIAIYRFQDGKIIQAWIQTDPLGLLQQIGVIPQDLSSLANTAAQPGGKGR